ncbi:MAG: REP-associated tyrosine transposase [Planctomyces sp.]|jgi:putative transposase
MAESNRKTLRRFETVRHLHELTFSCYRRLPLLTNDGWRLILSQSVDRACQEEAFTLVAFVFMPEHVHLLVLPQTDNSRVSRLLARIKQPASKRIRQILEANESLLLQKLTVQERPGKRCFRFWQEGAGFDRNLFSPEAISASIDYIHMNPVRRKLCRAAVDFQWSSARFHLQDIIDPELPSLCKPDPEWFHPSGHRFH